LFFISPPLSAAFLTADGEARMQRKSAHHCGNRARLEKATQSPLSKEIVQRPENPSGWDTHNGAVDGEREIPVCVEFSVL
jgi:hypothetical protein